MLKLLRDIKTTFLYYWRKFRRLSGLKQLLIVFGLLYVIQLLVPTGTLPVFAKLDGTSVGLQNKSRVTEHYAEDAKTVDYAFGTKTVSIPTEQVGVTVHTSKTMNELSSIGWPQKLVPLYTYVALLLPTSATTQVQVNEATLNEQASKLSEEYSRPAVNAKPTITKDLRLNIEEAKAGYKFTEQDIVAATKSIKAYDNQPSAVGGRKVEAQVKAVAYDDVYKAFTEAVQHDIKVSYNGKEASFKPEQYAPWLEIVLNNNVPAMQFSEQGFTALQSAVGKEFSLATSTKDTAKSRIIAADEFRKALNTWLVAANDDPTVVPTKILTSTSANSASLQAVIDSWIKTHGTGYQVSVQEIGGQGRVAGYKSSQQTVLASTYKIFVAYGAYKQAEAGLLDLSTPVYNGQSIETCISRAIIYSDNECAKAVGRSIGWAKIQDMVAATGASNIQLNNYFADGSFNGDKTGSALEIGKFLRQLHGGSLLDSTHTNRLLGYMKQQVYRGGIPAGSAGSTVADKVGFLDNYTHDAAIVYAPKTTYVLVIMSDHGANWVNIKSLASAISTYLNK